MCICIHTMTYNGHSLDRSEHFFLSEEVCYKPANRGGMEIFLARAGPEQRTAILGTRDDRRLLQLRYHACQSVRCKPNSR